MDPERVQEEQEARRARLRAEIAAGRDVVVVVGAGVSRAVTGGKAPLWRGLLEQALEHCGKAGSLPAEAVERQRTILRNGEADEMLGVAGVVTKRLGGTKHPSYARWVTDTFSPLAATKPAVIEALASWKVPLATTNYDLLLEEVTQRGTVTWKEPARVLAALGKAPKQPAIVHLHGVYTDPESVVLDGIDYDRLLRHEGAQGVQRGLVAFRTLVFVGCGGTLTDPNLGPLFAWLRESIPGHEHKHFQLCLASEREKLEAEHARDGNGIDVVVYGEKHDELAAFLWNLAPAAPPVPDSPTAAPLRLPTASADTLRREYLNQLVAEAGRVDLGAVDPGVREGEARKAPRLESIYTSLRALGRRVDDADEVRRLGPAERELPSALSLVHEHARLVLLGDPGSGKSTLLRFLALCLAGELCASGTAGLELLRQPLPKADGELAEDPEPWALPAAVPVLVTLRDFAATGLPAKGEKATHEHVWAFLGKLYPFAPVLRERLEEAGAFVLFDGLDEVPEADAQREQLVSAVQSFADAHPRCRIVVTSRPYAYQDPRWRLHGFVVGTLAPFDAGQRKRFVRFWYADAEARGAVKAGTGKGRAGRLEAAIFRHTHIRELACRPLLLTLMASLHAFGGKELPEKREGLYAEMVELLLHRWEGYRYRETAQGEGRERASLVDWLEVGKAELRRVLEDLAYEAHSRQPGTAGTADVPEGQLLEKLIDLSKKPGPTVEALRDFLLDRSGILVPRGPKVYTFPHRSFQEYLAACCLTRGKTYPKRLVDHVRSEPERWREVALLAGARASSGHQGPLWQLVEALLASWEGGDAPVRQAQWDLQVAGQAAAESTDLEDVAEWDLPKLERLRQGLAHVLTGHTLPARERALAGESLATLGDPRPEVMTLDAMQFCWVPAGRFVMGSDEEEEEKPQHGVEIPYDYWLARYPVTVAQWRDYVAASGLVGGHQARSQANAPVAHVTWFEALAFCRWLTSWWHERGLLPADWSVNLPSEAEWEKAARGGSELLLEPVCVGIGAVAAARGPGGKRANDQPTRRFPWGARRDAELANFDRTNLGGASALGAFAYGKSPLGCEELSGNLWEWTRSIWGSLLDTPQFRYEYKSSDGRENLAAGDTVLRVLRGGSYFNGPKGVRCAVRNGTLPSSRDEYFGFRVMVRRSPSRGGGS